MSPLNAKQWEWTCESWKGMAGTIAKYHCNYCEDDITNVRVKCSECPDFDLCLKCFSCGAKIGSHHHEHAYQLIDCGTFPIFNDPNSDWKAIEEIALLEAIEQYGFGNWSDIKESIGIKCDASQVKDHYNQYYVMGNIGKCTWTCVNTKQFSMNDHTCPNDCPLSPSLTTPLPAITEVSKEEQQTLGYMPKRDDFEREYDNEAESLVSTLSMNGNDDDELETALKLAHINMYQRRLMDRFRSKHVVRDYGLVKHFFISQSKARDQSQTQNNKNYSCVSGNKKKPQSSDSSDDVKSSFDDKLKQFCRFDKWDERHEFCMNLQREKELKTRIKELIRYRRNGLKRLNECSAFENARSKREKKKENKKKSVSNANIGSGHKRHGMGKGNGAGEKETTNTSPSAKKRNTGEESARKSDPKKDIISNDFDIMSLPALRLLSERERKLCASVKLRPSQYVTLKTLILKKRKGTQSKSCLENIDKSLRRKIVNFMVKSGWITAY